MRITVHVQPKAARTEVVGTHGDALKVRLAAPPVDGAANQELVRFLADTLGVSRSRIEIRSGLTSRRKVVEVTAISAAAARKALGL